MISDYRKEYYPEPKFCWYIRFKTAKGNAGVKSGISKYKEFNSAFQEMQLEVAELNIFELEITECKVEVIYC